ncbi:Glycosyltransferase [Candidatus Electrothrix aarhusensis]
MEQYKTYIKDIDISLVIPVLNEEESIFSFVAAVAPILKATKCDYELIFIDDGSTDKTLEVLKKARLSLAELKIVKFSRNFGKEAALTAGLFFSSGKAVIPMDVDLQDPPEVIPCLIKEWQKGSKVVHAVRDDRQADSWLKRWTADKFYKLMRIITKVEIPVNSGDFRLMDRVVVDAILLFPERNRFMKGIMAATGFPTATVTYTRPIRNKGNSKFNFWRLWNFALDGITGFSTVPLRVWAYIGGVVAIFSFIYACWIIIKTLTWGVVTPGFATLMTVVLFMGSLQLIGIGVLGEYIGRVFEETKHRPLYIIQETHGIDVNFNN